LKVGCNDRIFERKVCKKTKIKLGLLKVLLFPIRGHHFDHNEFECTFPWGKGEELTTKPTLFQVL
jgi:hypothetical protein